MEFDYIDGSKVSIKWGQENNSVISNFFQENFPEANISNYKTEISFSQFRMNFDRFGYRFSSIAKFTTKLREVVNSLPDYDAEVKNQTLPDEDEVKNKLKARGFKRELFWYQLRNVRHMASLSASANFSVPGAGKTTDTLATYLYKRKSVEDKVLIICPKSAFTAWEEDIHECLTEESLIHLGNAATTELGLAAKSNFKIINYERYRDDPIVRNLINEEALNPERNYLVVLDESHRMKGEKTKEKLVELSMVNQKIILTGTPMPQKHDTDLAPQFLFLYPEQKNKIVDGQIIKEKFQPIYKRTTKNDLGLPDPIIKKKQLSMTGAQLEVNDYILNEIKNFDLTLNQRESLKDLKTIVMRYLQFSSNPMLQYDYIKSIRPNLAEAIYQEGYGSKLEKIIEDAEEIARNGEKLIIWSTFPKNLEILRTKLAFWNPVAIHGAIPMGTNEYEINTRRHALWQFKNNPECKIFLANPSTAGEGISLHKICSKAFYLDRSYNAAHYLQSRDRIHRIGIADDAEIEISLYLLKKSIDLDVDAALDRKTKNMAKFLNDNSLTTNNISFDIDEMSENGVSFEINQMEESDLEQHVSNEDINSVVSFSKAK